MSSAADTKELARRVPEDVATGQNLDLIDDLFAEDFVEHGPFGRETRGLAENREAFEAFLSAFPDIEATVENIVAEGDTAAMRVTLRGTHEGEFMGLEPTGESFEAQNMVFTRVADGKIAERWLQPDMLGMLQQLGSSHRSTNCRGWRRSAERRRVRRPPQSNSPSTSSRSATWRSTCARSRR